MQNLQKKHALLEADVSSHLDRIESIRAAADEFIQRGHFDADNIRAKQVFKSLTHPKLVTKVQVFEYFS